MNLQITTTLKDRWDSFGKGMIQPISQGIYGLQSPVVGKEVIGGSFNLETSHTFSAILRETVCVQIFIIPCSLLVENR